MTAWLLQKRAAYPVHSNQTGASGRPTGRLYQGSGEMKITAYLVLLALAGALFLLQAINIRIQTLDFVAAGLFFLTAAFVAEHMTRK